MAVIYPLPSPNVLKELWPAPVSFIEKSRKTAQEILFRKDKRLALLVGPCSIHDPKVALEYAKKLKQITPQIEHYFFPIMRLFIEKPRTWGGWKGLVYDPFLDGSNDMQTGLQLARKLWVEIAQLEVACATELLDPLVVSYFDDLIVWGLIGARTSASQPHRQMASGLSFPIGFKNDVQGNIDVAIAGIAFSSTSHSHLGIAQNGFISAISTQGNPLTHLVLRGSEQKTNFDPISIAYAMQELKKHHLPPHLVVDCAHGNSGKDEKKQKIVFTSVLEQVLEGNQSIAGLMLESHLYAGKQPIGPLLNYGVSITDSCMGWEETESLLMNLVHK